MATIMNTRPRHATRAAAPSGPGSIGGSLHWTAGGRLRSLVGDRSSFIVSNFSINIFLPRSVVSKNGAPLFGWRHVMVRRSSLSIA